MNYKEKLKLYLEKLEEAKALKPTRQEKLNYYKDYILNNRYEYLCDILKDSFDNIEVYLAEYHYEYDDLGSSLGLVFILPVSNKILEECREKLFDTEFDSNQFMEEFLGEIPYDISDCEVFLENNLDFFDMDFVVSTRII